MKLIIELDLDRPAYSGRFSTDRFNRDAVEETILAGVRGLCFDEDEYSSRLVDRNGKFAGTARIERHPVEQLDLISICCG